VTTSYFAPRRAFVDALCDVVRCGVDVCVLAEVTANTRRGARGYVLPAATAPGNPGENRLLEQTAAELPRLGLTLGEVAVDGALCRAPPSRP
jgi:hypothetical protein